MFDSTPENLPLEPTQPPAVPNEPRPVPRASSIQTPKPVMGNAVGIKEPEDIFSNVPDTSARTGAGGELEDVPELQDRPAHHTGGVIAAVFGILLLLAGVGGGAYYMLVIRPTAEEEARALALANATKPPAIPTPVAEPFVNTPPVPDPLSNPETAVPETTTTETPVPTPPNIPPPTAVQPVEIPPVAVTPIIDIDGDGLTDAEENLLGTNVNVADTDQDGFQDAAELTGFYSPLTKGGSITTMETIKVVRWTNVTFLMPTGWSLVDQSSVTATIQTQTGERFILTMTDAGVSSSISGTAITTKNNFQAMIGSNGISGDVRLQNTRLVITPADPSMSAAYKNILMLIIQSVRLAQ